MERQEQEEKIASMLGGLERTEAPSGFETRVMRRIAEAKESKGLGRPVLILFLKFAAPAAMLLLVGLFLVIVGSGDVNTGAVPPVQDSPAQRTQVNDSAIANGVVASIAPKTEQTKSSSETTANRKGNVPTSDQTGVNSADFAVQGPGETYRPLGIDPRPRNVDPSVVSPPKGGVPVAEMLQMIGVDSKCARDGCLVASVRKGGLGERVKVLPGDLIVKVDGRKTDGSTNFSGTFALKSFEVVRDGRAITLTAP